MNLLKLFGFKKKKVVTSMNYDTKLCKELFKGEKINLIRFGGCYNEENYGCKIMYVICTNSGWYQNGDFISCDRLYHRNHGFLINQNFEVLGLYKDIAFECGTIFHDKMFTQRTFVLDESIIKLLKKLDRTQEIETNIKLVFNKNKISCKFGKDL